MTNQLSFADVAEGVRRTIAAYTMAVDDGRTDDIVATFCADGGLDIPFMGVLEGHDALRTAFEAVKPRQPQRHLIVNTLVTEWDDESATALSDMVYMTKGQSGWVTPLAGRYTDQLHNVEGAWLFHHRAAVFFT